MRTVSAKRIALLFIFAAALCFGGCSAQSGDPSGTKAVNAAVVGTEKFGHALLGISAADFAAAGYEPGDVVCVSFDDYEAEMPYFDGYYTAPGQTMLRGLSPEENIAVCINYGDFCEATGIGVGDTAEITMVRKAGMLEIQNICSLKYSHERNDYPDDTSFSNFRAVTAGRIGEGKLYRTASPINNKFGRAPFAGRLIEEAGVNAILNLSESNEDIEAFLLQEGPYREYYRTLYENGQVKALDLAGNFFSEEFAACIADGLTFLSGSEPPYCIHCIEGKDRAGFTAMLLEALMGASLDEITHDYMLTYRNYYGITEENEPERYGMILDLNLYAFLCHVTGADDASELAEANLEAAAEEYLLRAGMTEDDINSLKEKLH